MARTPLYSRSPQRQAPAAGAQAPTAAAQALPGQPTGAAATPAAAAAQAARLGAGTGLAGPGTGAATSAGATMGASAAAGAGTLPGPVWRRPVPWMGVSALLALALVAVLGLQAIWPGWRPRVAAPLTLAQIDRAVRESIAREPLPSATAAAYQAILPSVVRVTGDADEADSDEARTGAKPAPRAGRQARRAAPDDEADAGTGARVGTGVVIVDSGLILTNLHVVAGAQRIRVTFSDGSSSQATVVNRQPDKDLAVLQAQTLPDDLQAATMRATQGLSPGDAVVAVGFPFGIGPSASAGVVSGLKREFRSPRGQQLMSNLIQFDAAANPGNSGGPLVTLDGHVVGIVTAIMNPEGHSTFIGIGFAVPIESAATAAGLTPF